MNQRRQLLMKKKEFMRRQVMKKRQDKHLLTGPEVSSSCAQTLKFRALKLFKILSKCSKYQQKMMHGTENVWPLAWLGAK